ncbi:MAG: hypothetical protein QW097_00450 [archaeon]
MKGQAFDTFQLMIAAVVAVMILAILLSILGGITVPGQEFDTTVAALLQSAANSPCNIQKSSTPVKLKTGTSYSASSPKFVEAAGKDIEFECAENIKKDIADCGTEKFTPKKNVPVDVYAVCGSEKCIVGIGGAPKSSPQGC